MLRALISALFLCSLTSCVSQPDLYAPPAQRKPLDHELLSRLQPMLDMNDPNADAHIVRDIRKGTPDVPWRWTRKRPEIKLALKSVRGLTYEADFSIPDVTFKETGPVTITFFVNDRVLDSVACDAPGRKTFAKAVPPEWLKEMSENRVGAEIDKVVIAKGDGETLGFILHRMGLAQQ